MATGTSTSMSVAQGTMPEPDSSSRSGVDGPNDDHGYTATSYGWAWASEWGPTWDSPDEVVMGRFGTCEGPDVC